MIIGANDDPRSVPEVLAYDPGHSGSHNNRVLTKANQACMYADPMMPIILEALSNLGLFETLEMTGCGVNLCVQMNSVSRKETVPLGTRTCIP